MGLGPLVVLTLTDVTAPASEVPVVDMNESGRRVNSNTTTLKIQRQVLQILHRHTFNIQVTRPPSKVSRVAHAAGVFVSFFAAIAGGDDNREVNPVHRKPPLDATEYIEERMAHLDCAAGVNVTQNATNPLVTGPL